MLLLALDVGNTNVSVGVFEDDRLIADFRLKTDASRTVDEYAALLSSVLSLHLPVSPSLAHLEAATICSVVPAVTTTLQAVCMQYLRVDPLIISAATTETDLSIDYDPPASLGADRLVNAFAAFSLYVASEERDVSACIVADFGTATKIEAIGAGGHYLGGAILPGIGISLDALFGRAALLRQIPLEPTPISAIGRNTADALRSGILFGYAAQVDGMVERIRRELDVSKVHVIATGGYAALVAPQSATIQVVDQNLTVTGLSLLYRRQFPATLG